MAVTYAEWLQMPEVEDADEEVVDGEIRITPPAKVHHARIVSRLCYALTTRIPSPAFEVITARFGLIIRTEPLTCRVPDLAILRIKTIVERDAHVHSPPELIAEVLSPEFRPNEREEKLVDYASLGVPEFWVVSPEERTVEVLYLEGARYRTAALLAEGILKPREFPHVQIDIATIWPD
jgi:Uma2 family endonuclease